jgi:hypothetical protein
MSLQLHFLQSHLDFFPGNTAAFSEEQGEKVPAGHIPNGKRYSREWNSDVLADYCWTLRRETPNRRIQETKDDKKSFLRYIYLFLARILYRDTNFHVLNCT